jgi:hypothetical protein
LYTLTKNYEIIHAVWDIVHFKSGMYFYFSQWTDQKIVWNGHFGRRPVLIENSLYMIWNLKPCNITFRSLIIARLFEKNKNTSHENEKMILDFNPSKSSKCQVSKSSKMSGVLIQWKWKCMHAWFCFSTCISRGFPFCDGQNTERSRLSRSTMY